MAVQETGISNVPFTSRIEKPLKGPIDFSKVGRITKYLCWSSEIERISSELTICIMNSWGNIRSSPLAQYSRTMDLLGHLSHQEHHLILRIFSESPKTAHASFSWILSIFSVLRLVPWYLVRWVSSLVGDQFSSEPTLAIHSLLSDALYPQLSRLC